MKSPDPEPNHLIKYDADDELGPHVNANKDSEPCNVPEFYMYSPLCSRSRDQLMPHPVDWISIFYSLSTHPMFIYMTVPDDPLDAAVYLQEKSFYSSSGASQLDKLFLEAAALGTVGLKAIIVMEYIWLIAFIFKSKYPDPDLVNRLICSVMEGCERGVLDYSAARRLFVEVFRNHEPPPSAKQELESLVRESGFTSAQTIIEAVKREYPHTVERGRFWAIGEEEVNAVVFLTPRMITRDVVIPANVHIARLLQWGVLKLGIGSPPGQGGMWQTAPRELYYETSPEMKRESRVVAHDTRGGELYYSLIHGPTHDFAAFACPEIKAFSTERPKMQSLRAETFVYLCLSLHPMVDTVQAAPQDVPWHGALSHVFDYSRIEDMRLRSAMPDHYRTQIAKRAEVMLYVMWLVGHGIPMNRVLSMLSCAVEWGCMRALLSTFEEVSKVVRAARRSVIEIALRIKNYDVDEYLPSVMQHPMTSGIRVNFGPNYPRLMSVYGRVKKSLRLRESRRKDCALGERARRNAPIEYPDEEEGHSGRCEGGRVYDVSIAPSRLLYGRSNLIVPADELTQFVMEGLKANFKVVTINPAANPVNLYKYLGGVLKSSVW